MDSGHTEPVLPRPLLLLDFDGPLNPFRCLTRDGFTPPADTSFSFVRHEVHRPDAAEPVPVLVSKELGAALDKLDRLYTIVWATSWGLTANRLLSPLLGTAPWPMIEWGADPPAATEHGGSWKTPYVARWLAHFAMPDPEPVPWVWVDSTITEADRDWFRAHYRSRHRGPTVPHRLMPIDAATGLREDDLAELADWARHPTADP